MMYLMWMCIRPESKHLTCLYFHPNGPWLRWATVGCVQPLCLTEKIETFFPLECLPSMCNVVILSTHVWIGVHHSLIHREITIPSAVLPLDWCGFHCIATQEFPYSVDCGHLKYNNKTKCSSWSCLALLLLLALQPTVGFSLLSDFLPFRPFLTQLSPPSYSHYLYIFFNVLNPSYPWSSSVSPTCWFPL